MQVCVYVCVCVCECGCVCVCVYVNARVMQVCGCKGNEEHVCEWYESEGYVSLWVWVRYMRSLFV